MQITRQPSSTKIVANNTIIDLNTESLNSESETANTIRERENSDQLNSHIEDDTLYGNEGNDILHGGDGNDVVQGGPNQYKDEKDNDELRSDLSEVHTRYATRSNKQRNIITGTAGDDILTGTNGVDTIQGLEGNDQLNGLAGDDTLQGNQGNDILHGGDGNDVLQGGQNDDKLFGDNGNDEMRSGLGNDEMTGGAGSDKFVISLKAGNSDVIYDFDHTDINEKIDVSAFTSIKHFGQLVITQEGADTRIGLGNNQSIILKNFTASNLQPSKFIGGASILSANDDILTGTSGNDFIRGGLGNDQISGLDGNDDLRGNEGNDILRGGNGNDLLRGGQNDDQVYGDDGDDTLYGDLGNNQLTGGTGSDKFGIIMNPNGVDTITDFDYTNPNEQIDLSAFTSITHFGQLVITQEGADTRIGLGNNQSIILKNFTASNLQPSKFIGGASNGNVSSMPTTIPTMTPTLSPTNAPGTNIIQGTTGDDNLVGTSGPDIIRGLEGNDQISGLGDNDELHGNQGNDTIYGGDGNDVIHGGQDNDQLYGQIGNDQLFGGLGDDTISGNEGDDIIEGGDGNDMLYGGKNNDKLFGDSGNDELHGGLGNNELTGGLGNDTFVIKVNPGGTDIIKDFEINNPSELIDLSAFGNIQKFSDLKIRQDGQDVIVDLGANQKLKLLFLNASALTPRNFRAAWSSLRQINIYAVGNKLDQPFTNIPNNVRTDVKNYVINNFDGENIKNSAIEKPWNKIDLTYFKLQSIELKEVDESTVIDLGQFCSLTITGVTPDKLDINKNFVLSTSQRDSWKNEITPDWKTSDEREIIPIKTVEDELIHDKGAITYYANPVTLKLVNKSIGFVEPNIEVFTIDDTTPQLQIIENFNPENSNQYIDISKYNIKKFSDLGIQVIDKDTIINVGKGKAVLLKNTDPNLLKSNNFIGLQDEVEEAYTLYTILSDKEDSYISNFDFNNGKLDLSVFDSVEKLSDLSFEYTTGQLKIFIKLYQVFILIDNPHNILINKSNLIKNYSDIKLTANSDMVPSYGDNFEGKKLIITVKDKKYFQITRSSVSIEASNIESQIKVIKNSSDKDIPDSKEQISSLIKDGFKVADTAVGYYIDKNFKGVVPDRILSIIKAEMKIPTQAITLGLDYNLQYVKEFNELKKMGIPVEDAKPIARQLAVYHVGGQKVMAFATGKVGGFLVENLPKLTPIGRVLTKIPGVSSLLKEAGNTGFSEGAEYLYIKQGLGDKFKFFAFSQVEGQEITSYKDIQNIYKNKAANENKEISSIFPKTDKLAEASDNAAIGTDFDFEKNRYTKQQDGSMVRKGKAPIPYPKPKNIPSSNTDTIQNWNDFANSLPEGEYGRYNGVLYHKVNGHTSATNDDIDDTVIYNTNPEQSLPIESLLPKIKSIAIDLNDLLTKQIKDISALLKKDFECAFNTGKGCGNSQILAGLLADVIQGKRLDEAVIELSKNFAKSLTIEKLGISKFVENNVIDKVVAEGMLNNFSNSLAMNLITQFATGKLTLNDDIGRSVSLYTASYITQSAVQGFAELIGLASFGFPIVGQVVVIIVVGVLMKEFGPEIIQAWDKIADIGEDTWDFVRDPINGVEDLWKEIKNDKWTYRTGTDIADVMYSDSKWENIKAGKGDDIIVGYNGWNKFFGEDGNDILFGGDGTLTENYIRPDEIYGGPGDDYINGQEANDLLVGNSGHDYIFGGTGDDVIYGDDKPLGSDGGDIIITSPNGSNDGNDVLQGNQGNDKIYAGGGNDIVRGGKDNDELYGDSGDDLLAGGEGADKLDGGIGKDTLDYSGSNSSVVIDLHNKKASGGHAEGDTFVNMESIIGSNYPDELKGDDGANDIQGNDGDDKIFGGKGNDVLQGNKGNDEIHGGQNDDLIRGDEGDDKLYGDKGKDVLYGGSGTNILEGGDDDDTLMAQQGKNTLTGGSGKDVFYIGKDVEEVIITDFNDNEDTINLSEWNTGNPNATITVQRDVTQNKDTVIALSDTQKLIIQNSQPSTIQNSISFNRVNVIVNEENAPVVTETKPSTQPTVQQKPVSTSSASTLSSPFSFIGNWFSREKQEKEILIKNRHDENESNVLYGDQGNDALQGYQCSDMLVGGETYNEPFEEGKCDKDSNQLNEPICPLEDPFSELTKKLDDDVIYGDGGVDTLYGDEGKDAPPGYYDCHSLLWDETDEYLERSDENIPHSELSSTEPSTVFKEMQSTSASLTSSGSSLSSPFGFIENWFGQSKQPAAEIPKLGTTGSWKETVNPTVKVGLHAPSLDQRIIVAQFIVGGLQKLSEWWYSTKKETPIFIKSDDKEVLKELTKLEERIQRAHKRVNKLDEKILGESVEWAEFSLPDIEDDLLNLKTQFNKGKLTKKAYEETRKDLHHFCNEVQQTWKKQLEATTLTSTMKFCKSDTKHKETMRFFSTPKLDKSSVPLLEQPLHQNNELTSNQALNCMKNGDYNGLQLN